MCYLIVVRVNPTSNSAGSVISKIIRISYFFGIKRVVIEYVRMRTCTMFSAIIIGLLIAATTLCSENHHIVHSRRAKRVAGGLDLKSNAIFNTQFFVEIRKHYGCKLDHTKHKFVFDDCQGLQICAASLIHKQFVITAAHCVVYFEYTFREIRPHAGLSFWDKVFVFWTGLIDYLKSLFAVTKPKHTIYSDYVLLAGGTNEHEMKQMRHAHYIFPHPQWIKYYKPRNRSDPRVPLDFQWEYGKSIIYAHDFLLMQTCLPFDIDKYVQVARMGSAIAMASDYERIVKQSLVCLYFGMGFLDYEEWLQFARPPYEPIYTLTNWTQFVWRSTTCYSDCNSRLTGAIGFVHTRPEIAKEHTCQFCSRTIGPQILAGILPGDSGGPVVCDGKLTAVVSNFRTEPMKNYSIQRAYSIHCARNMITNHRLDFYLKLHKDSPYHPLGTRRKHEILN